MSVLTNTNSKSNLIYLGLLIGLAMGSFFWLHFHQPSIYLQLRQEAFKLNYTAFKSGVLLAHYQFIATRYQSFKPPQNWPEKLPLLYNQKGFPIAAETDHAAFSSDAQSPQTVEDCDAIWREVLAGLKPKIMLSEGTNNNIDSYWVELTMDKICIYRDKQLKNFAIHYQSTDGKVFLSDLTP